MSHSGVKPAPTLRFIILLLSVLFTSSEARSENTSAVLTCETGLLEKNIRTIAAGIDGKVPYAELSKRAKVLAQFATRYPMQSVYKFPIAMATLNEIDHGRLNVEKEIVVTKADFVTAGQRSPLRDANPNGARITINELLRLMVSESDGTACDVLLRVFWWNR